MKTFNAFCGSAGVVYRKIMLIHLRKLCMVASSDWGATTYSPQFVYKASLLSKTLHTLWGVKGSHFEVLGGEVSELLRVLSHLLTTYKIFWRLLAAPSRKWTYPTWGSSENHLLKYANHHGGYVNFLEGIFFAWLVLLPRNWSKKSLLNGLRWRSVAWSDSGESLKFPMKCEVGMFSVCVNL